MAWPESRLNDVAAAYAATMQPAADGGRYSDRLDRVTEVIKRPADPSSFTVERSRSGGMFIFPPSNERMPHRFSRLTWRPVFLRHERRQAFRELFRMG
jgi:hypothetical protein